MKLDAIPRPPEPLHEALADANKMSAAARELTRFFRYSKKQDKIREDFIGHIHKFLKQLVFKALCSNLEHKPESALKIVTQIQKDTSGNITCIPMSLYMTNLAVIAGCFVKILKVVMTTMQKLNISM